MNKKIVAIAIAAVLAAPMALQAAPTVYGKMNVALEKDNNVEDSGWSMSDTNGTNSNVGVKGSEDLGNGLSAVYKIEFGLNAFANGALGGGSATVARNTYVGLAGGFGTALMGRHDTPYKIATDSLDPFANTTADHSRLLTDRRLGSVLAYISPSFGGLTLAGAVSLVEANTTGGTPAQNAAAEDKNDLTDIYSVAAMYSNGPIYASLSQESISDDVYPEAEVRTKLGLGYTINTIKLAIVAANVEATGGVKGDDSTTVKGYATFGFGSTALKLGYGQQTLESDGAGVKDIDFTVMTVGVDYSLSKSTKVYAIYDVYDKEDDNVTTDDNDYNTIALGMQVAF